ncbi:molybdopterin molybdotransferase MoeA [Streptomyces sulphureus]|uniref:molybdopterin molybdotransferase MoeA n=1 Tax=Streptomyces sulphureus TaxID=47758 RepID=UPI0003609B7C|nr:molybdopterin molybdotransferase MoeA [Streptomyces sulphureus]
MSGSDELDEAIALANWGRREPDTHREGSAPEPRAHGESAGGNERRGHASALDWPQARALAARAAGPLPTVTLPLEDALGHTLAAPLTALTDLPPFDTSAMDGWAVAGPGPWEPVAPPDEPGVLAGGTAEPPALTDGEAVRIATGARLPPGAGAVLRSERAELDGTRLHSAAQPQPGTDIRPRGQECRTGDRLLADRHPVTPPVLGLAAAAGYDRVEVVRRPRVEVLVLGDELLHRGLPTGGRIRDALGPMVGPWLGLLGAEVLVTRRLGDDAEALHEAVATSTADLVVTTGGTAAGPADRLRPVLEQLGARTLVDGVRVRPGHPMLLAALDAPDAERPRHLVGLPGNPFAALAALLTLAEPLLRTLSGRGPRSADSPEQSDLLDPFALTGVLAVGPGSAAAPALRPASAPLAEDVPGRGEETRLVPVRTETPEVGVAAVRPVHFSGPAMLRGIASASALAVVPPGGAAAGAVVELLGLPW